MLNNNNINHLIAYHLSESSWYDIVGLRHSPYLCFSKSCVSIYVSRGIQSFVSMISHSLALKIQRPFVNFDWVGQTFSVLTFPPIISVFCNFKIGELINLSSIILAIKLSLSFNQSHKCIIAISTYLMYFHQFFKSTAFL